MNNIIFIIISIVVLLLVVNSVRKKAFSIKESFWWVVGAVIMLLLSIFPYSLDWIALKLGISYPPSLFFVLCIVFLAFMNFRSSKKIADLHTKIIDLAQEIAIIKEKIKKD